MAENKYDKPQVGETVIDINTGENVKIIFGPFSKQYNYYYEVENNKGQAYKLNFKHIKNILNDY